MPSCRGQESHVAACGSHSAGMRYPISAGVITRCSGGWVAMDRVRRGLKNEGGLPSINESFADVAVGVYAAIPKKRPVGALFVEPGEVRVDDEHFLAIRAGARDDFPGRIADKTLAPEF